MGKRTRLYAYSTMYNSSIDNYSYAQKNASIWHAKIGKYCSISWNVSIGGADHDFRKVTTHSLLYSPPYGFVDKLLYDRFSKDCIIGNDVWIAAGAQILRGVTIGDGAVIGAGSVVKHNVEPYSIVAGIPARKIGQRCNDDLIADFLEIKWWDFDEDVLKKNINLLNRELDEETVMMLKELKCKNQ